MIAAEHASEIALPRTRSRRRDLGALRNRGSAATRSPARDRAGAERGEAPNTLQEKPRAYGGRTVGPTNNEYGEPSAYAATVGGNPLLNFAYERDDLGRVTKKTETRGGVARVFEYGYDLAGRLETVKQDGELTESYAFDSNGNRTSSMNSAGVATATFDAQDRIETSGSMVYDFTENGELESKLDTDTGELTTYEYDAVGNLRGVVLPDGTEIAYLVDGRGRRVGKIVDGVLERQWIWRGRLQPVAELDGAGNVVARYVYAEGVNVPEEIVTATTTYRLVKDQVGSVRMVVDVATTAVVQEMAYDSWGRVVVDTNPGFQAFGFGGGLHDSDTGLVRFGGRDYDPETGRWTAKDPIRFADSTNAYEYSFSAPTSYVDPGGTDPWLDSLLYLAAGPGGAAAIRLLGGDPAAAGAAADMLPAAAGVAVLDGPEAGPADLIGLAMLACAASMANSLPEPTPCKPCPPPRPGYSRTDTSHPHWPCPGKHTHVYRYEMHQNPVTCQCFEKKVEERVICH